MIELEVKNIAQLEWAKKVASQAFENRKNPQAEVWKEIGINRKQYFMPVNQLCLGMEVSSFLKKKGVLSIKSINTKEIDIGIGRDIDRDINRFFGATKEQLWFMPNEKAGEHQDALNKSTPDNWWLEAAIIKNDLIGFKEIADVLRPNLINRPMAIIFGDWPTVYLNINVDVGGKEHILPDGRKTFISEDGRKKAKNIQDAMIYLLKGILGGVVVAGRLPILSPTPMKKHQEQQIDLGEWLGEKD